MKEYTSENLRSMYLDFFKKRGHKVIPSASLIPENDPTVLFTTAGMHPLVPYLLGEKHPAGNRLTDVQKCVRTGDIDDVGDERHCTFFEMLGNWSLGDYFKEEMIPWSYEFLTGEDYLGIPSDKLCVLNGKTSVYETDLFADAIAKISALTGLSYDKDEETTRAFRVVLDHVRTATFMIGDEKGIAPSNTDQGYILRRIIRRAVRYGRKISLPEGSLSEIAATFVEKYKGVYPELGANRARIAEELNKEEAKFSKTLQQGLKEFEKCIGGLERKNAFMSAKDPSYVPETVIGGKQAFHLYDTYGFPVEITGEMAIKRVLSEDVNQKGSNITEERLRFDFNFERPMTQEEIKQVEALVNEKIRENIPVVMKEISLEEAKAEGFTGLFESKYGERVKTYSIGDFSKEICGGPHAATTGELGAFKIVKEQSSSAGVRRIKAVLTRE